jgi:GTPase involved in cell partitioning and DNA repair
MTYYENVVSGHVEENRVLVLTVDQFKSSKDSLIEEMKQVQKELNIKDRELRQASRVVTFLTDTMTIYVPQLIENDCNFEEEFVFNDETKIHVSNKNNYVTVVPTITNSQDLFIKDIKVWRNPSKKFIRRVFTWDWKKDIVSEYELHNSNDLIRVTDVRVIKTND